MGSRIFVALAALILFGCTNPELEASLYKVTPDMTPASTASLALGHIDTGFLYFGNTSARIETIDGAPLIGDYQYPLPVRPGMRAILVRVFRDPVASYACIRFKFEAGHAYVVRFTKPYMEKTSVWLEEQTSNKPVTEKYAAQNFREPINEGVLIQMIAAHPPVTCPPAVQQTQGPTLPAASPDHARGGE
jgi:hypothetical protein